ncbi:hypothetical protein EVAR_88093_1 [Eumeta japonica]|uniref:Uncharacterized protein n=1 Tax=Eumeta variegata TaxID=151549 RepID=A0A4C1WJC2_EUMVA|nr:hypothetical protein EVAR_88093_1 [Eumeta japonica]
MMNTHTDSFYSSLLPGVIYDFPRPRTPITATICTASVSKRDFCWHKRSGGRRTRDLDRRTGERCAILYCTGAIRRDPHGEICYRNLSRPAVSPCAGVESILMYLGRACVATCI